MLLVMLFFFVQTRSTVLRHQQPILGVATLLLITQLGMDAFVMKVRYVHGRGKVVMHR